MTLEPLDATVAGGGWQCPVCAVEVARESTFCQVCLRSRPMDHRGVPQMFSGLRIYFNGIIPRIIKHPSHAVEWRMAERHGAVCLTEFDLSQVNLLLYRPGYERSDKVRRCVESDGGAMAVPITWMLDCLLQSRQIHPALYRITKIPAVAQPTVWGVTLPHHQHPYFQMNAEEYAIPTSFPVMKRSDRRHAANPNSLGKGADLPPFFVVPPLQYTNVPIFESVCMASGHDKRHAENDVHDENYGDAQETHRLKASIEILACEQRHNKVDRMLFTGMRFLLSPILQSSPHVARAIEMCGGKVVPPSDLPKILHSSVTHVLYHPSDKKSDLMIQSAQVKRDVPGLALVQSNWAEDCMMLGEVIPASGMYVPTAKLMETLSRKFARR